MRKEYLRGEKVDPLEKILDPREKPFDPLGKKINPQENNFDPRERKCSTCEKKIAALDRIFSTHQTNEIKPSDTRTFKDNERTV